MVYLLGCAKIEYWDAYKGEKGGIREASALLNSERRKLGYLLYGELEELGEAATKTGIFPWLRLQCYEIG